MMDGSLQENTVTLEAAGSGNSAAVAELFAGEQVALMRFISARLSKRLSARLDTEDVVQDVFLVAVGRFPGYALHPSVSFPVWLHAIAVERLVDISRIHIRARKRSVQREIQQNGSKREPSIRSLVNCVLSQEEPPGSELDTHEIYLLLRRLIQQLPQCDQDLLRLRIVEERPIQDVTTLLGIKRGAVRMRQSRAVHWLRERLNDELPDEEMPSAPIRLGEVCNHVKGG